MSQNTSYRKGSVIVTFGLSTNSASCDFVKMCDGNEDRLAQSLGCMQKVGADILAKITPR